MSAEEQKPNVTELVERLRSIVADYDRRLSECIAESPVYIGDEVRAAQLIVWKAQSACSLPLGLLRQAASTITSQADQIATLTTRIGELEGAAKAVGEFADNYFQPWGAWKTAWWEGAVSDDAAYTAENAIKAMANLARAALTKEPT
jgi:hypothetical protein